MRTAILILLAIVSIGFGATALVSVTRMRFADGKWPWAAEVPIAIGAILIALGLFIVALAILH